MPDQLNRSFHRGIVDTIIGFLHTVLGFISMLWTIFRIFIIGYKEVFNFGLLLGTYNYIFESTSILLWISGIGILRGKRWGKNLSAVWAGSVILLNIVTYLIKRYYWGELAPAPGWGVILVTYYAAAFLFFLMLKPAACILSKQVNAHVDPKGESRDKNILLKIINSLAGREEQGRKK